MPNLIPLSDIIIPENRQRRDFDEKELKELQDSIFSEIGLMQPIVLRNDKKTLIAGERRYRALQGVLADANYMDTEVRSYRHDGQKVSGFDIPYVTVDELSEQQLHAAELAENAIRVDLSWQERARAIAELHNFRVAERGEFVQGSEGGQTLTATASEILGREAKGKQITEVRDALLLSEFLDDPLVMHAPDIKTAKKMIKEDLRHQERMNLAGVFDNAKTKHTLILGSSFDTPLPEGNFSVIVTDPPYGIDIHTKATFDLDKHEYDDSHEAFLKIAEWLPEYTYELAGEQCHLYCFCDIRRFEELFVEFELSGWTVWPRPIIWDKGNTGSFGNIEQGPRSCYEAILFANKGNRKQTAGYRDVINITQKTNTLHPASKPPELFEELLKRSVLPGDHVLDLFCGSGPIFPAAEAQKAFATGIEINPKYHAMCVERIEKL